MSCHVCTEFCKSILEELLSIVKEYFGYRDAEIPFFISFNIQQLLEMSSEWLRCAHKSRYSTAQSVTIRTSLTTAVTLLTTALSEQSFTWLLETICSLIEKHGLCEASITDILIMDSGLALFRDCIDTNVDNRLLKVCAFLCYLEGDNITRPVMTELYFAIHDNDNVLVTDNMSLRATSTDKEIDEFFNNEDKNKVIKAAWESISSFDADSPMSMHNFQPTLKATCLELKKIVSPSTRQSLI